MDLQGVLDLTLTTDPNIEFTFNYSFYVNGIIKPNVTELQVSQWNSGLYVRLRLRSDQYSHFRALV